MAGEDSPSYTDSEVDESRSCAESFIVTAVSARSSFESARGIAGARSFVSDGRISASSLKEASPFP